MTTYDVPAPLTKAIIEGRCIAFVGAGFSAPIVPKWSDFLQRLAKKLRCEVELGPSPSALDYEAMGQCLQDHRPQAWAGSIAEVLAEEFESPSRERPDVLDERCRLIKNIPFKAILTTNFDPSLEGGPVDAEAAWNVLREDRQRWWSLPSEAGGTPPIINLHGIATRPETSPVVLSRSAYRERLYDDGNYANFIRSAFAEYTVLFLGVSFTDAYLNELRSEVLNLLHRPDGLRAPWGYAVLNKPRLVEEFYRKHEGIQILQDTPDFKGFDPWLAAIERKTSVDGRLHELLKDEHVVWLDANHDNNEQGHRLLKTSGARIDTISSETEIGDAHQGASVILTHFGYREGYRAFKVLKRVNEWETRPPVIVFAEPGSEARAQSNRHDCLRRGAFEYTTSWSELYRCLELLFGRVPGTTSAF